MIRPNQHQIKGLILTSVQCLPLASQGDYTVVSQTVQFSAGQTQASVDVTALTDSAVEVGETFSAVLSSPSEGATLDQDMATINIEDLTGV